MTIFTKGDRVRRINALYSNGFAGMQIGDEATVFEGNDVISAGITLVEYPGVIYQPPFVTQRIKHSADCFKLVKKNRKRSGFGNFLERNAL